MLGARGPHSARAGPPPGPEGTALPARPGSRGPRLPPSTPPAAHKYSLGPEGAETDFPAPLLALARLPPREPWEEKPGLESAPLLPAKPEGRMRDPGQGSGLAPAPPLAGAAHVRDLGSGGKQTHHGNLQEGSALDRLPEDI